MSNSTCANCGAALSGPYCPQCGQRASHPDPTIREFLHETSEELFHWEGKIPRTAKALLFQPGRLTLDFLAGRRARWLPPLRVYLLCSLLFFLAGPLSEALGHPSSMNFSLGGKDGKPVTLTDQDREDIRKALPARFLGADRLIRAAESGKNFSTEIRASLPKAMFLLMPVFATLTWLLWHRRLRHYLSHLYVSLHLHAAWFLIVATVTLIAIPFPDVVATVLGVIMSIYVVGYTFVVLRRVFQQGWVWTIVKSVALVAIYGMCLVTVGMGLLLYAVSRS